MVPTCIAVKNYKYLQYWRTTATLFDGYAKLLPVIRFKMSGLNYGLKYRSKPKQLPEGVSFAEIIKKWVVRVRTKTSTLTTVAQFNTKVEAEEFYHNWQ